MKLFAFFSLLCLFVTVVEAQHDFGTPLIKGNIVYDVTEKHEEYCGKMLRTKTETAEKYQCKLTGIVVWDDKEIEREKEFVSERGLKGTALSMDNYTDTRKEGESWSASNPTQVPLFPMSVAIIIKEYGLHPCSNTYECSDNYNAVLIKKGEYKGMASHHGKQEIIMQCNLKGMEKTNKYLILGIHAAGSWFDNGNFENSHVNGKMEVLTVKENTNNCEAYWKGDQSTYLVLLQRFIEDADINVSRDGKTEWTGGEGHYTRYTQAQEGITDECHEEIWLMTIDTADFFSYVRERPSFRTFPFKGSYRRETINGENRSIYTIEVSGTLTLGKQPEFSIEGDDEQAFKEWVPGHVDYPDTYKPLSIKAKFSENSSEADTICFEINKVSHLPGICTNYPLPDENNRKKEEADIIIAPQSKQTDPNVIVLNDSVAKTSKKVKSAVLVMQSRDFGAHAQVTATAKTLGKKAECKYDGYFYLRIPYDMNRNYIADKWEDDMGIKDKGCVQLDDKDDLPADIDSKGDGLTAFEEYRGFFCIRDVEAQSDQGHIQRNGKHVRTSPLGRDVFIFDEDGLFARYYEKINPAEVHWHLVDRDQMKVVNRQQATAMLEPFEDGRPSDDDMSAEAQVQRKKFDIVAGIMEDLENDGYRQINLNSPDSFRNNMQYGLHILYNPVPNCTVGRTIDNAGNDLGTPLKHNHLIALPHFDAYKKTMISTVNSLMLATKHPALWQKYPQSAIEQVAQLSYEAMIPHEIGHGIGIPHHTKGSMTVVFLGCADTHLLNYETIKAISDRKDYSPMEKNPLDGECYFISSAQSAFWAMGVTECCMRYTTERELDFQAGKVLVPSLKYCRRGQQFTDANGNKVNADGCFNQIRISCRKK